MTLRPSKLRAFTECEHYGILGGWKSRLPHIAAWVGECVHAIVVGDEPQFSDPRRKGYRYDAITPDINSGVSQAKLLGRAVLEEFAERRWEVVSKEGPVEYLTGTHGSVTLRGTYDFIVRDESGEYVLCDLKTGRVGFTEWLQIGSYVEGITVEDEYIPTVALISAPRVPLGKPVTVDVTCRSAESVIAAARPAVDRAADVLASEVVPIRSPGVHCMRCPESLCGIRAMEYKEE